MRTLYVLLVVLMTGIGAGLSARAQQPVPIEPPRVGDRPQCTKEYVRAVGRLTEALEKLRTSGPKTVGQICALVELGSAWFGGELPDNVRRELHSMLGFDVDLERIKTQCHAGRDVLERELVAKLEQLKSELRRCDDTI
ncbi:MAG TPA: hypothetical protein VFY92_01355 [Hyphomicrobiaceae bacterium]|nr:hypothetical protein [Hyphomicrobiaceae bacterium]